LQALANDQASLDDVLTGFLQTESITFRKVATTDTGQATIFCDCGQRQRALDFGGQEAAHEALQHVRARVFWAA
jgi:hypothetical protein